MYIEEQKRRSRDIAKKFSDASSAELRGVQHVKKQIVIGPDDGSQEIELRYFSIQSGGMTPHHTKEDQYDQR